MNQLDRTSDTSVSIETRYSWALLVVTLVITSLSFGAVTSVPILLKPISHDLNSDVHSISLVHMSALVGTGFGGILLGRLLDRWRFFPIAIVGAVATAGGLVIASGAHRLSTLHLAYGVIVGGIGQAAFFGAIVAEASRWFDRHRPLAIAVAASGQSIGGLTVPLLLNSLTDHYGWRGALFWYGVFAGILLLISAFVFSRSPPLLSAENVRTVSLREIKRLDRRHLITLVAAFSSSNFSTFLIIGHLSAVGAEKGFSPVLSSLLLSALLGVTLIPRLCIGIIVKRCGRFMTILASTVVLATGTAWLAVSTSYFMMVIGTLLIGLGFGAYLPGYTVVIRENYPIEESGRRISDVYFVAFLAAGAGSSSGGWLRDVSGHYSLALQVAAGVACIAASILWVYRRRLRSI